jgi:alpha-tubulin suppressor-like RCC1 family protein
LLPIAVVGGLTFNEIDTGADHTCAITAQSDVTCWGSDATGQVGQGGGRFRRTPTPVAGSATFATVSAGENHSCGLTSSGNGYCWGSNAGGQLGDGTTAPDRNAPTPIAGGHLFAKISAGSTHTCALDLTGAAYCWGTGMLGAGPAATSTTPQAVSGGLTFSDIAVGRNHSCAVASDGGGYCWGVNASGQIGNGSTTDRMTPTRVGGVIVSGNDVIVINPSFSRITAGRSHSCGVSTTNVAMCWGSNTSGQLGGGTQGGSTLAVAVAGSLAFTHLSAGADHTCGVSTTNQVLCWGSDNFGQLGDGTPGGVSTTPAPVAGATPFSAVSAGGLHSCGLSTGGALYCWGFNASSQLGDGMAAQRNSPFLVSGGGVSTAVSSGASHACGVRAGVAVCWGSNQTVQIGDGLSFAVRAPIVALSAAGTTAVVRRK